MICNRKYLIFWFLKISYIVDAETRRRMQTDLKISELTAIDLYKTSSFHRETQLRIKNIPELNT
jgi:hypothetical protein